jgi:glutathione S-transferase
MLELYYLKEADSVCSNRAVIALAEKGIEDWTPQYIKLLNEDHFESDYLKLNPKAVVPTLVRDGSHDCFARHISTNRVVLTRNHAWPMTKIWD